MSAATLETMDGLTVGEAAASLGVTVRTLHHWHDVGLVAPGARSDAGYRLYSAADLARAQRVQVYRALELPLDEIATLLDGGDATASLREQRDRLQQRIRDLQGMVEGVERMIDAGSRGLLLTARQQAEIFGPGWDPAWLDEARERWGGNAQWREYAERAAGRDADDWRGIAEGMRVLDEDLAAAMLAGTVPGSDAANALAERHRATIGTQFACTHAMHVCLSRRYVDDERFRAHYDRAAEGLAAWLRAVIEENARAHGVDPATATWG